METGGTRNVMTQEVYDKTLARAIERMEQLGKVSLQSCLHNLTDREPIWKAAIQKWSK
jgi:hypothetical protein